jgi:hypothetical protein
LRLSDGDLPEDAFKPKTSDAFLFMSKELIHEYGFTQVWKVSLHTHIWIKSSVNEDPERSDDLTPWMPVRRPGCYIS